PFTSHPTRPPPPLIYLTPSSTHVLDESPFVDTFPTQTIITLPNVGDKDEEGVYVKKMKKAASGVVAGVRAGGGVECN
ncbi:hypothetical protein HK104_007930, partial [Borealophlyctis nickersoniae]